MLSPLETSGYQLQVHHPFTVPNRRLFQTGLNLSVSPPRTDSRGLGTRIRPRLVQLPGWHQLVCTHLHT